MLAKRLTGGWGTNPLGKLQFSPSPPPSISAQPQHQLLHVRRANTLTSASRGVPKKHPRLVIGAQADPSTNR